MKCANSSLLNTLIQSYPKVLYSIRAFTHALAYFNSCLNPYLYALLNRNFCIDLVDIIPSWRLCCKQAERLENGHLNRNSKVLRTIFSQNETLFSKNKYLNHDEDEFDDHEQNQTTNDVSCQVELLEIESNDISFHHHKTKLT